MVSTTSNNGSLMEEVLQCNPRAKPRQEVWGILGTGTQEASVVQNSCDNIRPVMLASLRLLFNEVQWRPVSSVFLITAHGLARYLLTYLTFSYTEFSILNWLLNRLWESPAVLARVMFWRSFACLFVGLILFISTTARNLWMDCGCWWYSNCIVCTLLQLSDLRALLALLLNKWNENKIWAIGRSQTRWVNFYFGKLWLQLAHLLLVDNQVVDVNISNLGKASYGGVGKFRWMRVLLVGI